MAQLVGLDDRDNDTQGHLNNCTKEHVLSLSMNGNYEDLILVFF